MTDVPTVNVCRRRTLPVVDPLDRIREAMEYRVSASDLYCLELLVLQGHLEVRVDRDTRATLLVPSPQVSRFIDAIECQPPN